MITIVMGVIFNTGEGLVCYLPIIATLITSSSFMISIIFHRQPGFCGKLLITIRAKIANTNLFISKGYWLFLIRVLLFRQI